MFPIFLKAYIMYDNSAKKLFFAIYIFGGLRLLSGYVKSRKEGGVYVHLKNKAIIIKMPPLENFSNKNMSAIFDFFLTNIYVIFNVGIKSVYAIFFANALNSAIKVLFNAAGQGLNVNKFKSELNVFDVNEGFSSCLISVGVVFNLFSILISIFANYKNRLGKINE